MNNIHFLTKLTSSVTILKSNTNRISLGLQFEQDCNKILTQWYQVYKSKNLYHHPRNIKIVWAKKGTHHGYF